MLFPKEAIIIGSASGWNPTPGNMFKSIQTELVSKKLFWPKIKQFHVFPGAKWFLDGDVEGNAIPNGVDERLLEITENNQNVVKNDRSNTKFLFYARLEECKGPLLVIEAFEEVKNTYPEIELHIAGTGTLENEISDNPLVHYHGYLNDRQIRALLQESDCFVYPTDCDTYGKVVLEALSAGLYVITVDLLKGNYDEFEEVGSLIYTNRDSNSIASEMIKYIESGVDYKRIEKTRQIIRENYSWMSVSSKLYDWILSI